MLDLIQRNLRNVMLADGAFSLVAGIAFATLAGPIAKLLGPVFTPGAIVWIGAFLTGWGIFHLVAGAMAKLAAGHVLFAIAGDALWIVASAALLVADWNGLSTAGVVAVGVIAVAVADIMLLKLAGLASVRSRATA